MATQQIRTPLPVYTVGTIAGTAGSPTLTGTATNWVTTDASGNAINAVMGGDLFVAGDRSIPIKAVVSATQITLENPLPAAIPANSAYRIIKYSPNLSGGVTAALAQVLAAGSDSAPEQSWAVDNGGGRVKVRIAASGNPQIAVGPSGTPDGSLTTAIELPQSGGVLVPQINVAGASSGIQISDRNLGATFGLVYRTGGVNRLWDSAVGDVFTWSGTAIQGYQPVTLTAGLASQGTTTVPTVAVTDSSTNAASTAVVDGKVRAQAFALTPQMPAFASLVAYASKAVGTGAGDDYPALQAMFNASAATGIGWNIPDGLYLTSAPLTVLQPSGGLNWPNIDRNYYNLPPVEWHFGQGAIIKAFVPAGTTSNWTGAKTPVITFGGNNSDYSQYLHNAVIRGGIIEANLLTAVCVSVPFFNSVFIYDQHCRNFLLRGWNMGAIAAPAASAGSLHHGCTTWRDPQNFRANITSITKSNPCVVTAPNHGYPLGTGRVVSTTGIPSSDNQYFDINVLDANTFQLLNTDSTNWTFPGTAQAYLAFPSMRVPRFITGVTNANPCVITTAIPHAFTAGQKVFIADVGGMPQIDGVFQVTPISGQPNQFSIAFDSTSYGSYANATSPGTALAWVDPDTMETAVYYENATDADDFNCVFVGNRIGFRSNPLECGYDGKHIKCHQYNFNSHGEIWTGYDVGGDNSFDDLQIDGPFRFTIQCRGPRNRGTLCQTNYTGGQGWDRYASPVRLEVGAQFKAGYCDWKSSVASLRLLQDCSGYVAGYTCQHMHYSNCYGALIIRTSDVPAAYCRFTPGSSPVVLESSNVSSVTRNGAGDYNVNFTLPVAVTGRAFPDVTSGGGSVVCNEITTNSPYTRRFQSYYGGNLTDCAAMSVDVYGPYIPASGVGAAP